MRRQNFFGKNDEEVAMKKSHVSVAQIMGVLREAEGGMPVHELCPEHGITGDSFYNWRVKDGGMDPSMTGADGDLGRQEPAAEAHFCQSQRSDRSLSERRLENGNAAS